MMHIKLKARKDISAWSGEKVEATTYSSALSQFREPNYLGAWNRVPTSVHFHYQFLNNNLTSCLFFFCLRADVSYFLCCTRVPFPRATKEIGDVCTQASFFQHGHNTDIISFKQNIQSDELLWSTCKMSVWITYYTISDYIASNLATSLHHQHTI